MSDGVDYEKEALSMGWQPLEKFKGDPEKWVDAEAYVERGRSVMPILRKNNERLQNELLQSKAQIDTLTAQLGQTTKIVERLETHYNEGLKRQLANQRKELRKDLIEARKEDDAERELEIEEQLDELDEAEEKAKKAEEDRKKEKAKPATKNDEGDTSPEFKAWKAENEWFGVDKKKTKAILRAAEDLRDDGDTTQGREFFEKAAELAFGEQEPEPKVSKVEGGNARSNSRGGGSKTFASLPREAQQACLEDVDNLVGEGKMFKTADDWKKYYAKVYYGEEV